MFEIHERNGIYLGVKSMWLFETFFFFSKINLVHCFVQVSYFVLQMYNSIRITITDLEVSAIVNDGYVK